MTRHSEGFMEKKAWILLLAVLTLALGLRVWQMDRPALWEDDYLNLDRALMPVSDMWYAQKWQAPADTPHDFQPPLFFVLSHLALDVSGTSLAARSVSLLAAMLSVWGLFSLGRRLFTTEVGFLAAILLSLSLFHLEYSRAIKAYSVFFCLSVWSTYFTHRAITRGRFGDWLGWALTATGMLYSAYIGLPTFAGQVLWAGAMAAEGLYRRSPGSARQTLTLAGTACAVGLAYLPWLPAVFYVQEMLGAPDMDPLRKLTWGFARDVLTGFSYFVFNAPVWFIPSLMALTVMGAGYALFTGRTRGLLLLLFWVVPPTAAVLMSKSIMNNLVSSRHLFNLLGLLTLLPAAGAWAAGRLLRGGNVLALVAGVALCLGFSWPQIKLLPGVYGRSISQDREYLYSLWAKAIPGDALQFEGDQPKTKAFAARWYLPGLYGSPGDFSGPGPRKLIFVENRSDTKPLLELPEAATVADDKFGPFRTRAQTLVMLSRSPLAVWPDKSGTFTYADDFSTLRLLSEAYSASNAAVDLTLENLVPARASQPGEVVYRFIAPEGVSLDGARLILAAKLFRRHPDHPTDARIDILAGPGPDTLKQAGSMTYKDFLDSSGKLPLKPCQGVDEQPVEQTCCDAGARIDLPRTPDRELWLGIRFQRGKAEGVLGLDSLRLEVKTKGSPKGQVTPVQLELASLLAGNSIRRWQPGAASSDGIFAFAAHGDTALAGNRVGSPEDLQSFRTEHPGLAPVHVLRDGSGKPLTYFYYPPLALSPASPALALTNARGLDVRGIVLSGKMSAPSLQAGGHRLDIPVTAPRGSVLMLNPGGRSKLLWSPDFSKKVFDWLDFSDSDNMRPSPDGDNDGGLTCREERPCRFAYRFASGLPMSRVRLEWYPRVVADPTGKNAADLSYSTDGGKTFIPLERFIGSASGKWTGLFAKHVRVLVFPEPVHQFILRTELTGEAAQLWSHSREVDRMWLEADLDSRAVEEFSLSAGDSTLKLIDPAGNDLTVRFLDKPAAIYDSIKDWR